MVAGIFLLLLSASVNAQVTPPATDPQPEQKVWDAKKNPTVDSIAAKYSSKLIPARAPLTVEQIYPVLGQYESTANADAPSVVIVLDETNKGIVWVDGLPQGRIKALLRKSPSTYKIPAQKTADGKSVSEGTLFFNQEANTLNIVIGKEYNDLEPSSVFVTEVADEPDAKAKTSKTKSKVKIWTYSGNKVVAETAATTTTTSEQ